MSHKVSVDTLHPQGSMYHRLRKVFFQISKFHEDYSTELGKKKYLIDTQVEPY